MKNIQIKVENGDLIGILVPVGDGKTCLLNSKLNNLDVLNNQSDKKNKSLEQLPKKIWNLY